MIMPKLLCEGDTVAITATSGVVNEEKLNAGVKVLKQMGLNVRVMQSCFAAHEYLAGTDELRLRDLHCAFADKNVRAIFCARGGYGASRLLPHINYTLIRRNPKIFAGYSDVTALHIALNKFCKLITFHAPMPAADLHIADELTISSFKEKIFLGELLKKFPPVHLLRKCTSPSKLSWKTNFVRFPVRGQGDLSPCGVRAHSGEAGAA
jgi:muramoyltetrapeptide carboxypeptidase